MRTAEAATRRGGPATWLVAGLPLVVLWAAPLVVAAILLPYAQRTEVAASSAQPPAVVAVGERATVHRASVTVDVTQASTIPLEIRRGGVVTDLFIERGDALPNGAAVLSIDGVTLVALTGQVPLYRDLRHGYQGADVETVATLLRDMGLLDGQAADDQFGPLMARAVCEFQLATGAACDGIFRVDGVVYAPEGVSHVDSVAARLGMVIEPGAQIAAGEAEITTLSFSPTSDISIDVLRGSPVVLRAANDASLLLPTFPPAADSFREIADFLATNSSSEAEESSSGGPTDGVTRRYTGFTLELETAMVSGVVPNAAVYVGESGAMCLFAAPASSPTLIPLADATPTAGELASLSVPSALVDIEIVRDPMQLSVGVLLECE